MHCDKCNIDFSEGLRYCKWCGEALVDRPRVTSELHTCPSCAVAVQPGWAYCKACGERLSADGRQAAGNACPECGANLEPGARACPRCGEDLTAPRVEQSSQAAVDAVASIRCTSCGEQVDPGTLYCKACGSAVYSQETPPFGDSALLCVECNTYSPYGSRACRVCGALFSQGSKTVVDRPAFVPRAQGPHKEAPETESPYATEHPSGAHTIVFEEDGPEEQPAKPAMQTSVLPGTAGSKSEQQTHIMQMGRITSPVEEGDAPVEEPAPSGNLEQNTPGVEDETATVVVTSETALNEASVKESTAGFSSQPGNKPTSETSTTIFASPQDAPNRAQGDRVSQDNVQTREVRRPSASEQEPRVPDILPVTRPASDGQRVIVPASRGGVTREISSADSASLAFDQTQSQPLPRKRTGVFIASAVVVVLVIAAAVFVGYWLLFSRGRATRSPAPQVKVEQPTAAPAPPATPPTPAAPVAPEGMVVVAAGSHTIGRNGADPLEQPQHKVDLPAFFIDRTEVTNAAYKKFVDATGRKPPTNWTGANFPSGRDNYPVTGVTWQDAADYASWAGKRLPSEDEWEAAARGTDDRVYPWGNQWRAGLANNGRTPDKPTAEQYPSGLREVGGYPQSASPSGAVDMIGNAWEWMADEITLYPGNTEPKAKKKLEDLTAGVVYRVIRGGAYDGNQDHDATYRGYLDASQAYPKVGFRCAKDAK